jgi:hypothetical protein
VLKNVKSPTTTPKRTQRAQNRTQGYT